MHTVGCINTRAEFVNFWIRIFRVLPTKMTLSIHRNLYRFIDSSCTCKRQSCLFAYSAEFSLSYDDAKAGTNRKWKYRFLTSKMKMKFSLVAKNVLRKASHVILQGEPIYLCVSDLRILKFHLILGEQYYLSIRNKSIFLSKLQN